MIYQILLIPILIKNGNSDFGYYRQNKVYIHIIKIYKFFIIFFSPVNKVKIHDNVETR